MMAITTSSSTNVNPLIDANRERSLFLTRTFFFELPFQLSSF